MRPSAIAAAISVVAILSGCAAEPRDYAGAGASGQGGDRPLRASAKASVGANGSGAGGAAPPPTGTSALALSGIVTNEDGAPIAGASVSLAANAAISASTNAAGEFLLVAEFPMGKPLPPRWPASRPVEHTIIVTSAGYLDAHRGVPAAKAAGETIGMLPAVPEGAIGAADDEPRVAEYSGDRLAAVTMTFDDTKPTQLTAARPLFDLYGYKATFYINSANIGPDQYTTWDMWKEAANAGFEIGNHSRSHWVKPECTPENAVFNWDEIHGGYEDILAAIGKPPLTFALPGGGGSPCTLSLVVPAGHIDHRRNDHIMPTDRLYPEGDDLTVETGVQSIDTVIAHTPSWNGAVLSWFLFYMHDVTAEREAVLEAMLDHVAAHDAEVWCTGYGEVTVYQREREQSVLEVLARAPRSLTFRLSSPLDPAVFSQPLTVVIPLPAGATDLHPTAFRASASKPIEVRVRPGALQVDVVPGAAPVHVRW